MNEGVAQPVMQISGVVPSLAQVADLGPWRSEIGVGCLMPWCGKLYVLNYNSHRKESGTGTGLRVIERDLSMTRHPAAVDGTYSNRMVHFHSNQIIIGPHVIDEKHQVRTIKSLVDVRLCGTAVHLKDPERQVYMLGMEGELFELDVYTLVCRQIADLQEELFDADEGQKVEFKDGGFIGGDETGELNIEQTGRAHFKDCYSGYGRLVVCSNEYNENDWAAGRSQGRLAEWDGSTWTILDRKPYGCVHGRGQFSGTIFASGWDRASAVLKVYTAADNAWRTWRFPKGSHTFDHKWATEWPRIREVEHERFMMDLHGIWYELSPWAYGNHIWGVRPVSTHLWVHGDFCSWQGMLVVGCDNASPDGPNNTLTAEPQSGLWFGKTDDLWSYGKPAGWGGPWWESPVRADEPSDPYLMTGFEHKCLHLAHQMDRDVTFTVEIDMQGGGRWMPWRHVTLGAKGYECIVFPDGFSAHWLRLTSDTDGVATAQLFYT